MTASRQMAAPAARVWAVLSDHQTWTSWHEDYDEHAAITDQAAGFGAKFRTKEWILRSESEVVRWEPDRAIGLSVLRARGLRWLIKSYYSEIEVEPQGDDGCLVRYRSGFRGTWLFWLLSAYTVGQTLGSIYFDSRSSLKQLDRMVMST